MKGFMRSTLFGGAWTLVSIPLAFLLFPGFFPLTVSSTIVIGLSCLVAAAFAVWLARRLPATHSWLIAILGWVVGFHLVPAFIEIGIVSVALVASL